MATDHDEADAQATELPQHFPEWAQQWPTMLFAAWWNMAFDFWRSPGCAHHEADCHDLVVPDPIEREGEHALFA